MRTDERVARNLYRDAHPDAPHLARCVSRFGHGRRMTRAERAEVLAFARSIGAGTADRALVAYVCRRAR